MSTLADEAEFLKILFYGDYGAGKTTSMAYMSKLGVIKWIRTDKGIRPRRLTALGLDISRIEPVDNFEPITLEKSITEWRELLAADPGALAGVCLDTGTELLARRIEVYVDQDWRKARIAAKRDHVAIDPLDRYISGDVRDQYKGASQEIRRMTRALHDLPCHVAIACQMRFEAGQFTPDLSPAIRGDMIGYAGIVIRLQVEGDMAGDPLVVGYPRPDATHVAKDQYGMLPSRLAYPTFDRVLAYVQGDLDKDTDPTQLAYKALLRTRKEDEDKELED
jgi:hypothetical protein